MKRERVRALLDEVAKGTMTVESALASLDTAPLEEIGVATIDHHRALRQGFPEVVMAEGKEPSQVVDICERLAATGDGFLVTRASGKTRSALRVAFPRVVENVMARTCFLRGAAPASPSAPRTRTVAIVTAGTGDLPVAEEAAVTLAAMGHPVLRVTDVGIAGIHRILDKRETLGEAAVVIVIAGMDGALPSVVGGLLRVPVIAVPTSVGYGAAFGGLAPLLTMLNSCAAGVTVCNIDNGFGAAVAAARILDT